MGGSGIRRKVDDLGRVVIPSSIRQHLGLSEGTEVEISLEGHRVVVSRPADCCVFCEGVEHVAWYMSKPVCWSCTAAIRALDRERTGEVTSRFGL